MEQVSEYPGPGIDDYANVLAMNKAYIEATCDLKSPQRGRLAATPFLLFSLRENDIDWWDLVLAESRQGDLMAAMELDDPVLRLLQSTAISFLWHLGRRNPYAARIISGATISWCEKITAMPLLTLLNKVGTRDDLMLSRLHGSAAIGKRLLGNGTSSRAKIRRSSQLAALQTLLTRTRPDSYTQLPAAACRMSGALRVLDKK